VPPSLFTAALPCSADDENAPGALLPGPLCVLAGFRGHLSHMQQLLGTCCSCYTLLPTHTTQKGTPHTNTHTHTYPPTHPPTHSHMDTRYTRDRPWSSKRVLVRVRVWQACARVHAHHVSHGCPRHACINKI